MASIPSAVVRQPKTYPPRCAVGRSKTAAFSPRPEDYHYQRHDTKKIKYNKKKGGGKKAPFRHGLQDGSIFRGQSLLSFSLKRASRPRRSATMLDDGKRYNLSSFLMVSSLQIALALFFLWRQLGIVIMIPIAKAIAEWTGRKQQDATSSSGRDGNNRKRRRTNGSLSSSLVSPPRSLIGVDNNETFVVETATIQENP
jgi:hypothetical protein